MFTRLTKEGAESITCSDKIEFGLDSGRYPAGRDHKNFVCIDMKFNPNYLTACVDAISIYDVECAGFSPHEP